MAMRTYDLLACSMIVLFLGCKDNAEVKMEAAQKNDVRDTIATASLPSAALKVTAHLIYKDGTLSAFDVLNDKSVGLWNTIIGAGDALQPSECTKLSLSGDPDSLHVKITNGHQFVVDTMVVANKEWQYIINNTGCDKVYVHITKSNRVVYNDTIPFHCGE
jgi:hypothetical protein